ncbi:PEP/pyruvate-binding domain-containing protein [Vallitalea okinawensis]|uniref:PEP/pyruvate-binding domain-containing protein n=1 Tax=Vallitalea okinawensis TaxID=2078660 RepID=UPI000CFCA73D|nr:PEP/pyruvate-binding domain-containing protein [Vallitalea okinawensis]
MRDMIYDFLTKKSPKLSEVGGKAKALIETTKAGFPVPEGIALTVEFFSPWLDTIKSTHEWTELLLDVTKENCDGIKAKATVLKFTEIQKVEFEKHLCQLHTESIFAVRSSSPEEDLEGTSFAGMYETYLGITIGELESYVAKAFASMFDYRVMAYKEQNGINIENTRIAVIIQKQIASDVSGVGFSLNPNNNCYDEVMINAAFGLGETIVSGTVSPDTYIVNKVNNQVLEKKVNEKKHALYLLKDGGTIEKSIENPLQQALRDNQIIELTKLITKCESHYGMPMDTEWAYENGKLYLLQSRPITTYFPLYEEYQTKPSETRHLYIDMIKLTQGFEYSMSELGNEMFTKMIVNAKQGIMPEGKDGAFYSVNGRMYMDLTNMEKALGEKMINRTIGSYDVPTKETLKNFNFKNGYHINEKPAKLKGITSASIKMALGIIPTLVKTLKDPMAQYDLYFEHAERGFKEIDRIMDTNIDFNKKADAIMKMFYEMMIHAMPMAACLIAETKIKKMFKDQNLDTEILALSIDLSGNPTSQMGYSLVHLASFDEVQKTEFSKVFAKGIQERTFSKEFLKAYDEHMQKFGCRCVGEIDTAAVRPYENIEDFFRQLKLINIHDNAMQTSKQKKEKAYQKLLETARYMKKEKKFIKYAKAYNILGIREHPKYMYVYANDKLRQVALKLAKQFVKEGRLDVIDDIFMLTSNEITEGQHNPHFDLKSIVTEKKKVRGITKHVKSWPTIIDSRGKIFRYIRQSESGDLVGDAVSPGIIKGRAKVLLTPFEKPLHKGEILVAKATEPTWTPIFINAAAVVMEVGGPLQHGAIIAREYGIPCVTGIDGATTTIKDGDLLEVDGSSGIVKIIKD